MRQLICDLFRVRRMRRQITDLTAERNHLINDRARLIGQLFGEFDERD